MVIHVRGANAPDTDMMLQRFIERQHGRELLLGKKLIGWNLHDTVVVRSAGLTAAQLQEYVRHFAPQRHVVFDHMFPAAAVDRYCSFAGELRNYVFAFLKRSRSEPCPVQNQLKDRAKDTRCEIVTLNPDRGVQQIEVLLMSASPVLGTDDPLVLPQARRRRTSRVKTRKTAAAA